MRDPDQQKMAGSGSAKNGWIRTTGENLTNGRRQEGSPQPFNVNFYYNPFVTFYDDDMSPFLPRIHILIFCTNTFFTVFRLERWTWAFRDNSLPS
jgi:hypothetical protein